MNSLEFLQSTLEDIRGLVEKHIHGLSYPMDSWLEERLLESALYRIVHNGNVIGYAGLIKDTLHFFYVEPEHFRYAPAALEQLVGEEAIKRVFVMSQDSMLCALISEWDFEKEMAACWFSDAGGATESDSSTSRARFRAAIDSDVDRIREISGDFFDEVSSGFSSLEERVAAGMIFVLEDGDALLGCGIAEKSRLSGEFVSIGMFVNRRYRRMGAARTVLLHLKDWAYRHDLVPVAGCWYYNTLSRKSLESAGMVATSIGFDAVLKGKEKLPLRTGNPPGELVE